MKSTIKIHHFMFCSSWQQFLSFHPGKALWRTWQRTVACVASCGTWSSGTQYRCHRTSPRSSTTRSWCETWNIKTNRVIGWRKFKHLRSFLPFLLFQFHSKSFKYSKFTGSIEGACYSSRWTATPLGIQALGLIAGEWKRGYISATAGSRSLLATSWGLTVQARKPVRKVRI